MGDTIDVSYEAALLAEIIAAPADDAPRLVWADQEGGPRGELVIVQCELARGMRTAAESGAFRRRQRELLAADGVAWSGLDGLAKRCRFRRGFVELATFDARTFHDHLDEVLAVAPLLGTVAVHFTLTSTAGDAMPLVMTSSVAAPRSAIAGTSNCVVDTSCGATERVPWWCVRQYTTCLVSS